MNSPADNKKPTSSPPPSPTPTNNVVVRGDKGPSLSMPPDNKVVPPTETKVESKPDEKPDDKDGEGEGTEANDKTANRSKLFIVVGEIHEFATAAKAEQFLNQPNAPKTFKVVRGHEVQSKQRVSLRG